MSEILKQKVKLKLVGLDSNAFALMGAFREAARRQRIPQEDIRKVLDECMSGDYNHLLCTLMDNTENPEDEDDEDDDDTFDDEEPEEEII